ncbi:MAG: YidC/Oxa1 family rane protein insertase [Sphingomonadales bacterium]|nr:YidC/Oxa1 family rane protein insertase [Sphingomonadales bacterium]
MNDHRNMILAVVLSVIVLFGWNILAERFFPTASEPSTKVVQGKQVPVPQRSGAPTGAAAPQAASRPQARPAPSPRIRIETPRLRGSVNLRGARIDDLLLTTHRRDIGASSPPVRLFAPEGASHAYYGSFGWTGDGLAAPGPDTIWRASGDRLVPGRPITLSWDNGRGQLFEIVLAVDDGYMFTAEQRVSNRGAGPIAARAFGLINRTGRSPDVDSWTMHVGPMGVFNGGADYGHNWDDVAEAGTQTQNSNGGWLGFTDKYWLAAVIPAQGGTVETAFRHIRARNTFQADYQSAPAIVQPGQTYRYVSHMFAGAKEVQMLDRYSDALGTPIERAIDWGWFRWFMIAIYSLLNWLFAHIGNFGVAIICLTLIVRGLLFPIAQKQFASMAAMRVLQPKIKQLQERHKDDKARMQQEMLKLYKEEKVNPMAGCLPILLQIPIFYALYKVLLLAVEMRHEPFALWIRDLSAPDPLTPVNLFGYLDFHPSGFLAIGVLPILLGITMWLQFRLNPAPMDPVQKQVFAFMPWVLMFLMAPFAAGLQLYWTINNIISIAQQKLLYARHPVLRTQAGGDSPAPAPSPAAAAPAPSAKRRPKRR